MVKKGENDLSRSAYLFRFADMIYDMRFNGHSTASIVDAVNARLVGRRVSRPTISEFLKRVDDQEFRAAAKAYCEKHNLNYVEWHEIAKLAHGDSQYAVAAPVRQGDSQAVKKMASKPESSAIQSKTETPVSMPTIQQPRQSNENTQAKQTVIIDGLSEPAEVITLPNGKTVYMPSRKAQYQGKNPLDDFQGTPALSKSDLLNALKSHEIKSELRLLINECKLEFGRIAIPDKSEIHQRVNAAAQKNAKVSSVTNGQLTPEVTQHLYMAMREEALLNNLKN